MNEGGWRERRDSANYRTHLWIRATRTRLATRPVYGPLVTDRYRSLPGCSIVGIAVTRVRTSHGFTEAARLGCLTATACKPTVASYQSENKSRGIQWSVGRRNAGTWDVSRISFASTAPHALLCSARYAPSVRAHRRAPLGA